jgi:pimeloyl-ACP methyl ester carboxylesterase
MRLRWCDYNVRRLKRPHREEIVTDFVLIHGAYQGGWIWKFVSERLRAEGHNVLAPTLEGCGERAAQLRTGITTETHGEEIAKLLFFHDLRNAVLVGTSSGGMVMACAAEQARDRVARVVFADALALLDGESILDIVKRPTTTIDAPVARGPDRKDAVQRLFASLEPGIREWAADRVTLHPAAVYNQPVKLERFWDLPWDADVLYCSRAPNPGEAHIRRTAERLKARWHVIDTGHYPMLSTPDDLARIILG